MFVSHAYISPHPKGFPTDGRALGAVAAVGVCRAVAHRPPYSCVTVAPPVPPVLRYYRRRGRVLFPAVLAAAMALAVSWLRMSAASIFADPPNLVVLDAFSKCMPKCKNAAAC